MAGTATEDSSEEAVAVIDDGVPDSPPQRSDKVLTQPPENKLKTTNGIVSSEDLVQEIEDVYVNEVFIKNTEDDGKTTPEETVVLIDDVATGNVCPTKFHFKESCFGFNCHHLQPADITLKPLRCDENSADNFKNVSVVGNDFQISKPSEDDDVIFVTSFINTTVTSTLTAVQADCGVQCTSTSSVSSSSSPRVVRRRRKRKMTVVPRRNPKRVAQMEKASVDLAMKLSMPKRIFGSRTKSSSDVMVR